ncbi:hypothetical protein [Streptomyces sp. YIM 132580]|uniref:hypothetical protein n=1 Tax=unclassified Streptomyces TaxID=2593676 RepID=UPI0013711EF1|nr:hypothetical protein [Streptomyces sp. YIM 132580]MXG26729.1 hypothetical protein [Streptomyces sp. YIM 132580]
MSDHDAAPEYSALDTANSRALQIRALYEQIEQQVLGRTWTLPELAVGFTHDAAYVGRLVLAAEGTWDIEGDKGAELEHKLAECLWWSFVLAERLGIDAPRAFEDTMDRIEGGLRETLRRINP